MKKIHARMTISAYSITLSKTFHVSPDEPSHLLFLVVFLCMPWYLMVIDNACFLLNRTTETLKVTWPNARRLHNDTHTKYRKKYIYVSSIKIPQSRLNALR